MELNEIREEIKDIDIQILELAEKRLRLAVEVGRNKARTEEPVRNLEVERKVIERYRMFARDKGMNPEYAEEMCRIIMKESVEVQAALPRKASSLRHIAIIGGNGKMGRWLADLFANSGHRVDIIDPSAGNGLTTEDAKFADTAVIAIPISRTRHMLEKLDTICSEDALIFDIASLKSPFLDILKGMGSRRKVCSVHPMFGPSAGSMYDRNMVVCDCGSKEAVSEAVALFENNGPNIRKMPVEEHDKYMSYVLGLSHAVNIAFFTVLERSGIPYDDMRSVASVTFSKLMDTNESVALEDPYLYYEIQHLNSSRDPMLNEFNNSVRDVVNAALSDDPRTFRELMDRGREYFS